MSATGKSFSQYGEDHLVWKFFGEKKTGYFVDVGANDGEDSSQSFFLEGNGWNGILVEPQSDCCDRMRLNRPRSQVFQVACGAPEQRGKAIFKLARHASKLVAPATGSSAPEGHAEVQVLTLNDILEQTSHPQIDFLSIDVEGLELQVLRGFDIQKYRPRLIIIEDNLPNRLKVHWHIKRNGYRLVKRTGCNNWYVPRGQSFPYSTTLERLRLFRKMYLGTLHMKLRLLLTGH